MQTLLQMARRHALRIVEFLGAAVGLWALQALDQDLATGVIRVPFQWQPYVPLVLGLCAIVVSMLSPQVLRLRTAAVASDTQDPPLDGLAEQIVQGVTAAITSVPVSTSVAPLPATLTEAQAATPPPAA